MKTINRMTLTLAAFALAAIPALAQGTAPQAPSTPTVEQREAARLEAEAAAQALAADRAAAAEMQKQLEYTQQQAEKAKQQAEKAVKRASKETEHKVQEARKKVQEALTHAERERERALYDCGVVALDQARYEHALQAFAEAAALRGERGDGALYWKAFAEYKKQAALQAALESLKEIQKEFPHSRWLDQARALEFEVRHASGEPVSPAATPDEELKLLALNSLLHTDSEQALPMIEKMINGAQSPRLKKRALFVLSQSRSPKAREILKTVARNSSSPDLQLEALQYLQMSGGVEDRKMLSDLYAASKDRDVKRRILRGYMAGRQRDPLLAAARGEADASLRRDAVRMLGTMQAAPELQKMYQVETSAEIKRAILDAYMVGGESERLLQVARSDADPALRRQAVRMLGVMGPSKTGDTLAGLYWADGQSKEVRAEVVNGLFIQGNAKALVDIARKETNPAMRKTIVERLSMMKSKEATDFLLELINK